MVTSHHRTENNLVEEVKNTPLFPEARISSDTGLGLAERGVISRSSELLPPGWCPALAAGLASADAPTPTAVSLSKGPEKHRS